MIPDPVVVLADRAAPWLLTYLLHSSVLIGGAWLLERVGVVHGARALDLIWRSALVGGFATATLTLAHATTARGREVREVRAVVRQAGPTPEIGASWSPDGAATTLRIDGRAVMARASARCTSLLRDPERLHAEGVAGVRGACGGGGRLGWPEALVLLWLCGASALGAGAYRGRRRLSAALARCRAPGPRVAAMAQRLLSADSGRAEVVVSRAVRAPCAVGRRVLLPPRCEEEMPDGELRGTLAHELAHVARHDPAWLSLADAVCRFAWLQPLNRVAAIRLRDAAELVCDERALRHVRPVDLARSLQRVSAWALPTDPAGSAAGLVPGGRSALGRRVARILAPHGGGRTGSVWIGVAWTAALVAGVYFLPPVRPTRYVQAVFIARAVQGSRPAAPEERALGRVVLREVAGAARGTAGPRP